MDGFYPASRKNTFFTRKPVKCFSYFFRWVGSYQLIFKNRTEGGRSYKTKTQNKHGIKRTPTLRNNSKGKI